MQRISLLFGLIGLVFGLSQSFVSSAPTAQTTTTTWRAEFFANRNLQGEPIVTRQDDAIDFVWQAGSPDPSIPVDDFSARWTRWLFIDTPGNWTFTAIVDDGVRLFIDDVLVIDAWNDQTLAMHSATVNLSQSFHLVRMEYYERSGNAQAQLFITSPNFPDWRGEYYANPNLAGAPEFTRNDSAINFDFGNGGPGGGVPGTNFSVRWTRNQFFNAGRYRFTTTTDDGVRLWVDGQLLIDQWQDQTPRSWSGEITLNEGTHWLRLEYFQRGGNAQARLNWTPISSGELWRGEFFNNPSLDGTAVLARDDLDIDFDWASESPGRGIARGSNWSARWTSQRTTRAPGFYTASVIADDGVRVWVDGNLLIDQWHDQSPTAYAAMVYLTAGQHDWRVEYYQHGGGASLRVQIVAGTQTPTQPRTQTGLPAREILIDPKNPGFVKSVDGGWQAVAGGFNDLAYSIKNSTFSHSQNNWVRWYPGLIQAGEYEISVYVPANVATTRHARYVIAHAGTFSHRELNQSLYLNQWVSLGKFYFAATGDEYVSLSDITFESAQSTIIVADAVKFSAR